MDKWHLRFVTAALSALALYGCSNFDRNPVPGTTAGVIYVGAPRVSSRERLINERRAQEEWLKKQLDVADAPEKFGTNALIDTRNLSILSARLQARVDPAFDLYATQQKNTIDLAKQQGESALALEKIRTTAINNIQTKLEKGEIDVAEAKKQLEAVGFTKLPDYAQSPTPAASAPSVTGAGKDAAGLSGPFTDILKSDGNKYKQAPDPNDARVADKVQLSPVDLFRDLLAYRGEVNNEINNNALDDAHDLYGHVMYRMIFDATVVPYDDTSAWANVNVKFNGPTSNGDLWQKYRTHLQSTLQKDFLQKVAELIRALDDGDCNKTTLLKEFLNCGIKGAFAGKNYYEFSVALAEWTLTDVQVTKSSGPENLNLSTQLRTVDTTSLRQTILTLDSVRTGIPGGRNDLEPGAQVVYGLVAKVVRRKFDELNLEEYYQLFATKDEVDVYPPGRDGKPLPRDARAYLPVVKGPGSKRQDASPDTQQAFRKGVEAKTSPRVYVVTPQELAQRVSDVSAHRSATELLMGLSAIASAAGIDAMLQSFKENEAFFQTIRRQPLVVGYTDGGTPDESPDVTDEEKKKDKRLSFGWMLGPQFSIIKDGSRPAFRHTVRQQALAATVVVPVWWDGMTMEVSGRWRRDSFAGNNAAGTSLTTESYEQPSSELKGNEAFTRTYKIPLPNNNLSSLDGIFSRDQQRDPDVDRRYRTVVQEDMPATLLIRGENLWRATEVLIGSQRADSIRLLPDMRGLVARFDKITSDFGAPASDKGGRALDIAVATSDGFVIIGSAQVLPKKSDQNKQPHVAAGIGRHVVAGTTKITLISPGITATRGATLFVRSSMNDSLNINVAELGQGPSLALARDGKSVSFQLDDSKLRLNGKPAVVDGNPIDLYLTVLSPDALLPENILLGRDVIYYSTEANGKAAIAWGKGVKGLLPITIKLPPAAQRGFAGLSEGTVTVKARLILKDGDNKGESVALRPQTCDFGKDNSCVVTFPKPQGIFASAADGKAPFELSVELQGAGEDVPELVNGVLPGK